MSIAGPDKQLETYIQQFVDANRYGSKSEVLREGIRLIQDRDRKLAALDSSIMCSIVDADKQRSHAADRRPHRE
ncbi:type II toxin-antitoxin system ParD family antitoxin [Rhizobium sp. BK491]|uniref:type II toxin-antitoxin system ParD family antitoxin n=1 Tax=Rhizobium sp. BK491 TaxID=2587009 RepID=UPI00160C27A6|nr:antitoxin ParD1/3/4 [Rhizobium sp. BK491]